LFLFIGIVLAGISAFVIQIGWQARIRQLRKTVADLEKSGAELKLSAPAP
jgi:hypothetical protein